MLKESVERNIEEVKIARWQDGGEIREDDVAIVDLKTEDGREADLSDVVELRGRIDDLEAVLERVLWLISEGRSVEALELFAGDESS